MVVFLPVKTDFDIPYPIIAAPINRVPPREAPAGSLGTVNLSAIATPRV